MKTLEKKSYENLNLNLFPNGWKIPLGNKLHDDDDHGFTEKEVSESKNEDPLLCFHVKFPNGCKIPNGNKLLRRSYKAQKQHYGFM